ncbi:MAG: NYN domain-containing protein [Chloroflexi bacterium]|nr:NYN domain-containing protein [Chloroflexota bacterium]
MPYLIDGHNLIPKLGLRLDAPDDEMELAGILREFARLKRQQVEVYFDGAPAGHAGTRSLGTVRAHFVKQGESADNAIRTRLHRMGNSARNWTVVSSDREVQSAARVYQAQSISSEEFARTIQDVFNSIPKIGGEDKKVSAQEVEHWLKLFNDKKP